MYRGSGLQPCGMWIQVDGLMMLIYRADGGSEPSVVAMNNPSCVASAADAATCIGVVNVFLLPFDVL